MAPYQQIVRDCHPAPRKSPASSSASGLQTLTSTDYSCRHRTRRKHILRGLCPSQYSQSSYNFDKMERSFTTLEEKNDEDYMPLITKYHHEYLKQSNVLRFRHKGRVKYWKVIEISNDDMCMRSSQSSRSAEDGARGFMHETVHEKFRNKNASNLD